MNKPVFCLMGPTASGKTALACELVQAYPFELISVDSALVYKEMDIGTGKPSNEKLLKVPHHLINLINPDQAYSAAEFCKDASLLCHSIIQSGKIPLLVGGSMMYFNALQKGLSVLPEADESVRRQLEQEAAQNGWDVLHQKLANLDPQAAARIHIHDTQRIQRALEVFYLTGTTMSDFQAHSKGTGDFRFVNLILFPEQRAWLHERIAQRFDNMLTEGFVEEVTHLQEKWHLNANLPSMRCVGYRQVLEYLQGDLDYSSMRDKGIAATRQLAKRQLTWLRHWEEGFLYDPQSQTFVDEIKKRIDDILAGTS